MPRLDDSLEKNERQWVHDPHWASGITAPCTGLVCQEPTHWIKRAAQHAPTSLADWWQTTADDDLAACVPKMREYGSRDLSELGNWLGALMGWELDTAKATELGCIMYLVGKLARVHEALARREMPSEDTMHDITVYSMMARCARDRGGWGE